MALKRKHHPLEGSGLVSAAALTSLAASGITTVEDLAGALIADPSGMASVLSVDRVAADALRERALDSLPAATRKALTAPVGPFSYGAIDPKKRPPDGS